MQAVKRKEQKGARATRPVNRFLSALGYYLVVSILILSPSRGHAQPKKITRDQARQLVLAQLESDGFDLKSPDLVVEDQPDDPDMPGFYLFSAYTIGKGMNFSAGAYAVGHRTVELWNWMHCWRFTRAKKVRALQKELRRQLGLSKSEYRRLSATRPFCFSMPTVDH
jgi:hypothetical protein